MRYVSIFTFLFIITMASFAQEEAETVMVPSAELTAGVCAVWNDVSAMLGNGLGEVKTELENAGLYEKVDAVREELYVLCTNRPDEQSLRHGSARSWIVQADRTGEQLSRLAADAALGVPDVRQPVVDRLALYAYRFQFRMNPLRTLAYDAVKTETVEVVREVPAPCEDASDACDDSLRPAIARWAKALEELTGNHSRANDAMREAVRIKREARAVGPSSVGLGALVNDWATRLEEQLALPENYIRDYFGLTDREERTLSRLMMDMRSEVALCLR